MACRLIISPLTGEEVQSKTWDDIRNVVESDEKADEMYAELLKPHFINTYGDWVSGNFEKKSVLNDIGEPTFEFLQEWLGSEETYQQTEIVENTEVVLEATPQQLKKFREWAKRAGLQGNYLDKMVINGKIYNARGIAKIAQNLYYIVKGSETVAEPEEIMHFAVNALSQTQPGLFNQMLNKIGNDPIYRTVFNQYKDVEGYRTQDGKPDVRKIKEEAITKRLVNVLIEKEEEGFWAEIWKKIKSWFEGLLKKADFDPFERVASQILKGETFGAENSLGAKEIADRIMKTNPQGEIGERFRKAYSGGSYRMALSVIRDELVKSENPEAFIDEYLNGSQTLAQLVRFAFADEFFSVDKQNKIYTDIKTNKGVAITKEINPEEKEEDGTPKQMYKVEGKWVKWRVTDLVKNFYKRTFGSRDITKSQYQSAVDDIIREYGVEGHRDIEHAFSVLVDDNGDVRTSQLDDNEYVPRTSPEIYKILRDNLKERLLSFPKNTKFLSEVIIHDPKKDRGGTIDFLAIEEDGSVNILDWKFMNLGTDKFGDVPWYKKRAYRIQIAEYRRILSEVYGVPYSSFKQTQAIPIKAEYTFRKKADGKKYPFLTGVIVGNINVKAEDKDYLLPVALESQSTGDKELDKLLRKLVGQIEKVEKIEIRSFEEKFKKAEQLEALEKAVRHLQMKNSILPLLEQAEVFNKDIEDIIETFNKSLKDKDFNEIPNVELSEYAIRLDRAFENIKIYTNLDNEVSSLFEGKLTPEEQKIYDRISDAVSTARRLESNLKKVINSFGEKVANTKGVKGITDAEVVVSGIKRLFNETSKIPTKIIRAMYEFRREAQNKIDITTSQESNELVELEKAYSKLADSKDWKGDNYFDILVRKSKDKQGRGVHKLIDQYQREFYHQARQAVKDKNYAWIKDNVDIVEYKKKLKEQFDNTIALINARPWQEDRKKRAIERETLLHSTTKQDSAGWFANYKVLRGFPLQKWESTEWLELHKPENKAALDLYNWIIKINKKAEEAGYIPQGKSARTFLPFVPQSLMERIVLGGEKGVSAVAIEDFLHSITVDEDTVGYGAIDKTTGKLINRIPRYLISPTEKQLSGNLIKNLVLYNEFVNRYKHISEMEGIALALGRVERNKGSILTSQYGTPIFNTEKNAFELTDSNDKNADLYDKQIATLIYGQKYVQSETFDQMLGKVDRATTAVNKFFGRKVLPEGFGDKQISMNRGIDTLNNWFQMKALGLSPLPALSNFIGGNLQIQINAGQYFTKMDAIKAEADIMSAHTMGQDGKKIVAAMKYFLPLTRDVNRDIARKLSQTPLTEHGMQDFLMSFMRGGDKVVEGTVFGALLRNLILIDGKIYNAREYVRTSEEYKARYSSDNLREIESGFEKQISDLIEKHSLLKQAEIKNDQLMIPGVEQNSTEVYKIRDLSHALSKRVIGNLTTDEVRGISQSIITNSMMIFKNWIPSLFDQRIGQLKYNSDIEAYEWGRMRTMARFISLEGIRGIRGMIEAVRGTKDGIKSLNEMYEYKKQSYFKATGQQLDMDESQFYDMVRGNILKQAKDLLITVSLMSLFFAAKALPPDDEEDGNVKNWHKFMVRVLDKISDEVSFYYSPNAIQQILNGSIFPSLGIFRDAENVIRHFLAEVYGIVLDDDLQESNQVTKYIMRSFPITSQLASFMPLYAPELAKDLGIQLSTKARLR